ncbi:MAG: nucleotide exchange factor GrpE [Prevotella sp.]|nr:nucleotide exchange factor GrpE [Prevotella sp.]
MGLSTISEIAGLVAKLQNENLALIHRNERQTKQNEDKINEILADFLEVVDTFDWAEETIKQRGLDQSQISTKAITRLLAAKTKTLAVLERHGVKRIEFPDNMYDERFCNVVGTEKDGSQKSGAIVTIKKDGYIRGDKVLRLAEVVVYR